MEPQNNAIKSALELALEKLKDFEYSSVDLKRDELIVKGRKLAARVIHDSSVDVTGELERCGATDRGTVLDGVYEIILANITLPHSSLASRDSRSALELATRISSRKAETVRVCGQIDRLLSEFMENKEHAYETFTRQFEQELAHSPDIRVRTAAQSGAINVEQLPQFQQQWQATLRDLAAQYEETLSGLKRELLTYR